MKIMIITVACIAAALAVASLAPAQDAQAGQEHAKHAEKPAKPALTGDAAVVATQLPSYPLTTCPITGKELGKMGAPVDYVVNGRLVRLCCGMCKAKVDKDSAAAIKKVDAAVVDAQKASYALKTDPVTDKPLGDKAVDYVYGTRLVRFASADSIAAFEKDPKTAMAKVDAALITAQIATYPLKTCVVSDEELGGEMGAPIDRLYGVRLVRFCCDDCPAKFDADPKTYLAKIDAAAKKPQ